MVVVFLKAVRSGNDSSPGNFWVIYKQCCLLDRGLPFNLANYEESLGFLIESVASSDLHFQECSNEHLSQRFYSLKLLALFEIIFLRFCIYIK